MKTGSARISSGEQILTLQRGALTAAGGGMLSGGLLTQAGIWSSSLTSSL
jgi:hypothetical protein